MIGCSADALGFCGVTYVHLLVFGVLSSAERGLLSSALKGSASGIGWESKEENCTGDTVRERVRE